MRRRRRNFRLLLPQVTFLRSNTICEDCLGHVLWRGARRGCYREQATYTMASSRQSFNHLAASGPYSVHEPGWPSALGRIPLRAIVYWLAIGLALASIAVHPLRYALYPISVLVLLTVIADGDFRVGDEALPFLAFIVAGLVAIPLATTEGLKDTFFTFAGVSVAFLVAAPAVSIRQLFAAMLVAALVYYAIPGDLDTTAAFDVIRSSSPFESNFGYLFALLAVFAWIARDRWLSLLCLALAVLALKRIAVLAAIAAVVFLVLGERKGRWILNPIVMVVVNLAIVVGLLMYGAGYFDGQIQQLTGQSANQIGLGRRALLMLPAREIMHAPAQFVFFGAGPGKSYDLATAGVLLYEKWGLHSDLVKILYEYGLLALVVIAALMYRSARYELRVAFLFVNILFVTDNTLIYAFFICLFVIGARATCDIERR